MSEWYTLVYTGGCILTQALLDSNPMHHPFGCQLPKSLSSQCLVCWRGRAAAEEQDKEDGDGDKVAYCEAGLDS